MGLRAQDATDGGGDRLGAFIDRHWRLLVILFWIGAAIWLIWERRGGIRWFSLGDTDDNMRMMQVRALIDGQGWYDLRQHRMNLPEGANIHWSRLVDLPIAGIKLLLSPLLGGAQAEKVAVTLAPLLPMGVTMAALAVTARRLVAPAAFAVALGLVLCAPSLRGMFLPLRIDHHGWQLAMVALVAMGLTDPKRARGGAIVGLATAGSLTIGLEMLPYLAIGGAAVVLMWIRDAAQAKRLFTYGASLAGGCAFSWLVFTSYDNSGPVCDALSPVWLSAMVLAGGLSVALAAWSPEKRLARLAIAAAGGFALAAFFAFMWPHCLGRLEQSSPELERLWLHRVREAMPIYRHGWKTASVTASLPVIGLIGYLVMLWRHRRDGERFAAWAALFVLGAAAAALLLWQSRAGPAAQLLSIPGATALAWLAIGWFMTRTSLLVRVVGAVAAFLAVSGIGTL
ncbi:MAG TPA: AcrB/AcrD/AcrF family protein, partial [Allosphingosinicella sp.]|nr:AcrB/AcrD/AcrF family protein [Allosphingosinicella sp.]